MPSKPLLSDPFFKIVLWFQIVDRERKFHIKKIQKTDFQDIVIQSAHTYSMVLQAQINALPFKIFTQ